MNSGNSSFDDLPRRGFTGYFIPRLLIEMRVAGQLTWTEVILVAEIHALDEGNPDGTGCFAANKHFATHLGVSEDYVGRSLTKLKKLGLVSQLNFDGRRRWLRANVVCPGRPGEKSGSAPDKSPGPPLTVGKGINTNLNSPVNRGGNGEMGFFEEHEPVEVNGKQTEYAKQLKEALENEGKLQGKFSLKAWAKQFGILERQVGEERLARALTWYVDHIGEPFVPQAFAGESFKRKFVAIEAAMARDLGQEEEEVVELNDYCKNLLVRLTRVQWPKGSAAQLPKVLKASYENYVLLQEGLHCMRLADESRNCKLAGRVLDHHLRLDFLYHWFSEVWNQIEGWDDWSGNLWTYRFHRGSKRLKAMGQEWIGSYTGRPEEWDAMMEEYVEGSKA